MNTLALDSSSGLQWVALLTPEDRWIYVWRRDARPLRGLFQCIGACVEESQLALSAVERIAVVAGPGSWTGIQSGLAAARSIALVTGSPIISLSRLEIMAVEHRTDEPVARDRVSLVDAGNGMAYGGWYSVSNGKIVDTRMVKRATYLEWIALLRAETNNATAYCDEEAHSALLSHEFRQCSRSPVVPSEMALTVSIAAGQSRRGADRYSFEPIFVHDPNPRPWQANK